MTRWPARTAGSMCQYWSSVCPSSATTETVSGRNDFLTTRPSMVAYTGVPFGHETSMPK